MRVSVETLMHREFWTPDQAAQVLGRGAGYWRERFDSGDVDGYSETNGRGICRYLRASSARALLDTQCERRKPRVMQQDVDTTRAYVEAAIAIGVVPNRGRAGRIAREIIEAHGRKLQGVRAEK